MGSREFEGREFAEVLTDLRAHGRVERMADFVQHGEVSTLAHTVRVARCALNAARRLRVRVSVRELVRGAVLHDYYLYDWHTTDNRGHALNHPLIAAANAQEDFDLTAKERNIITSHMWPLPPTRLPLSREAWLVCFADKWCSLQETLLMRAKR